MTRKTATATQTAETATPSREPSALRALVSEWKASNPEETEPDAVRKAEPSQDDLARAGKRSKRAPTEREDAIQRAMEEGLTEEQAEAYAKDAATGTAKLPAPKPAPAPKAPPVELDQAPAAAKAAKAARKPAETKATPTERKAKPAKQTSPERARQIEAMEQAEAAKSPDELAGIVEAATAKHRAADRTFRLWLAVRKAAEACAAAPADQALRAKLAKALGAAEKG